MPRLTPRLGAVVAAVTASTALLATPAQAAETFPECEPSAVRLDPDKLQDALDYADSHLRLSVQVFRDDCLVGEGAGNPLTLDVPWNVWSSTKSVVSMLTGIAIQRGDLGLDDPIGDHLDRKYGDAAHRAITVRQLLTETSGLDEAIISEAATVGTDPDVVHEAMAQPIEHEPGTDFRYSQRTPDLLAAVVEDAVGEDLQEFAQENLFEPIGIERNDWFWLRDRSGHTYGYAHLFIEPRAFAQLGLLAQHGGAWQGRQVIPANYLRQAATPTTTNPCYGFLFWTNAAKPCTGASFPSEQTHDQHAVPSAPRDMFAMVGAFQQNNFMIPSLDMTVTWTGLFGDTTVNNLGGLLSAYPADLYDEFFRLLMAAVEDVDVPDPGPLTLPNDFTIDPRNYLDPAVLLRGLAPNPECNVLVCDGTIPHEGTVQSLQDVLRSLG